MEELLCSIGVLFIRDLIILITLVWEALLGFGQAETSAANDGVFLARACTTTVTLSVGLSSDVPYHERGEHTNARKIKHQNTHTGEEAETRESLK
jgi:hypothetical protein